MVRMRPTIARSPHNYADLPDNNDLSQEVCQLKIICVCDSIVGMFLLFLSQTYHFHSWLNG